MAQILRALNTEWEALAVSRSAGRALERWSANYPIFGEAADLHDVLAIGYRPDDGPALRRALAELAPGDGLAGRVLLQALLGGLCNLARRIGRDSDAVDDLVSLAWERIRTYPCDRPGTVSGNVLLDVRKRYCRAQTDARRDRCIETAKHAPSAEDQAVVRVAFDELVAAVERNGVSGGVLEAVIRSRVFGESMADLASEQQVPLKVLWHRRWRAEARLRELPLAS